MAEIEISRQSAWGAGGSPERCLTTQLKITNNLKGTIDVRVLTVYATLQTNSHVHVLSWPERDVRLADPHIGPGESNFCTLLLPLDTDSVRRIEDSRAGTGKIDLDLRFSCRYVFLRPLGRFVTQAPTKSPGGESASSGPSPADSYLISGIQNSHGYSLRETIERDTWFALLTQLGWDEIEVVEIPVRRLKRHQQFSQAIKHLEDARTAFRSGDYDGTVTKARKACESAAAVADQDAMDKQKVKQAIGKLLSQAIPETYDEPKREVLSDLMLALADLRNLGAHGGNLRTQVFRHDAELSLTIAAAVFRYLGESLSAAERKG